MEILHHEKNLLYTTYLKLVAAKPESIGAFYQRLFETDPSLEALFKNSMHSQKVKWRLMLVNIVAGIEQPSKLRETMRELGQRHVAYGVKNEDYYKLIEAFLWAMQQNFGAEFTPQTEEAWRKFLTIIVGYAFEAL